MFLLHGTFSVLDPVQSELMTASLNKQQTEQIYLLGGRFKFMRLRQQCLFRSTIKCHRASLTERFRINGCERRRSCAVTVEVTACSDVCIAVCFAACRLCLHGYPRDPTESNFHSGTFWCNTPTYFVPCYNFCTCMHERKNVLQSNRACPIYLSIYLFLLLPLGAYRIRVTLGFTSVS
jgi:hypothetical protein